MYLEYHPHVRSYQLGDASEAFAQARHLYTPLGTPYRIPYLYDGKPHDYLPDFVGTLCDGGLLIAEAGREVEKRKGQAVAKAEVAQRLAHLKGGVKGEGLSGVFQRKDPTASLRKLVERNEREEHTQREHLFLSLAQTACSAHLKRLLDLFVEKLSTGHLLF